MKNKQESSVYEGLGEALLILANLQLLMTHLRKEENE